MYKIVDLFCGVGGFSYGFEMSNKFEVILGVDNWDTALETFESNHKNTKTLYKDLSKISNSYWEKYKGKVDVIIAGPPCQGFSMSGKRNILDERNNLFKEVVRVSTIVKPKIVVIENVVGLLSMTNEFGKSIKNEIIHEFEKNNYHIEYKVLTAADYGVPQNRKRVIFIASLKDNILFPAKTHGKGMLPIVTVGDALSNIPNDSPLYGDPVNEFQKEMSGESVIYNHDKIQHSPKIVKRMASVPPGGNWEDIPAHLGQGGGQHSNNYRRLDPDKPSITLKHASKSMMIHPIYNRTPTVREVARLQSFPDDFIIKGNKYDQHQQLANAVPPLLGRAISESVHKMLSDFND